METSANKYSRTFLEQAHKGSSAHKEEILACDMCGCFHCMQTFLPIDIDEWIEEDQQKRETAICPICGIDSVLSSRFPVNDKQFLREMHYLWFL